MRRSRGFTLVEAMSTVLVFGFFLVVLFMTIAWGFRSFSLAVAKSDVTTEARRLALFVEREFRSSTYFSVSVLERTVQGNRRDAVCFVSRNDWSTSDSYDTVKGAPAWNRYFVYYATTAMPFGKFVRLSVKTDVADDIGPFPFPGFTDPLEREGFLKEDLPAYSLSGSSFVESARVIASTVQLFEVKKIPTTQEVEMRLLLRQNGLMARRANGDREGGTFELQYRVQPQNTL